ncbi:Spectrin beta chain, non-erythrocytic 4 [Labeo rohita]|uniref:Spectrin beta chain, non-erythrocytic 4 n=1 Tax=Labeo rohita TaxID=84645 RepID=A0ABQ8LT93_LABRO|nr:Spectrin beta chain, non-erythrocytic 4 [Labeo rohita]
MECQMEEWYKEVGDLQAQAASIPQQGQVMEKVSEKQTGVETRIVRLIEPLKERRRILLASKEVHQVGRDLEDELLWIQERLPMATSQEHGTSHRGRVEDVLERAGVIASIRSPEADSIRAGMEQLHQLWEVLWTETEHRQLRLDVMYQAQQYYFDAGEVEAWLSEQELHMMNEETGKDEASTLQLLKKQLALEQTIEDYAETIGMLSQQCRQLLELGHPDCEQISKHQSQIDRLYVSLKDLAEERKSRLEQQYWLYQLNREVDELEQWIAEREVIASSTELGQDFEHVSILQEKFTEFATETGSLGQERVTAVNQMVDELIDYGHADAATIAEWKDGVNEAWADLMELMETRGQMLAASHQLHKFFSDCREVLAQIEDKQRRLPEVRACQGGTSNTSTLQRLMQTFEHDIQLLVTQVRQLQESAAQLRTVYAGEKAEAIAMQEHEVMQTWKELLISCEDCRMQITTATDKLRFFGMVRDQLMWMDSIICQIGTGEKPSSFLRTLMGYGLSGACRDVSSVEVLMNYHQSLKSEVEARNKSVLQCIEMGKTLLAARNPASEEIKEKLEKVLAKQQELTEKWDRHWEELQQMLEVHQFAQEAVVAEAWLTAQEPFLSSNELGGSVDEVEKIKAEQSKLPPTPLLGRKVFLDPQDSSPARSSPSSIIRQTIYEQGEPRVERITPQPSPSSVVRRLGSTVANYTPIMNGAATYRLQEARNSGIVGVAAGLGTAMEHKVTQLRPEFKAQVPQQKIEHIHEAVHPLLERERERERYHENVMAEVVLQEPGGGRERLNSMVGGSGSSRSELLVEQHPPPRESRLERQLSTEQLIQARRDELPQEVWRERAERAERRLERQTSSEQEGHEVRRRDRHRLERQDSSEQEAREQSDRRSGGGDKRSTLAEIVEQLQEREAAQARGEVPRLPNGFPEKSSRPDRPRARDRPKPRRRPRPKEPTAGETRRSRSAPAQSSPPVPQPPTHTAQREGFLFRKIDIEGQKKSSNRSNNLGSSLVLFSLKGWSSQTHRSWVNLYCVLNKGELGFYKDAKNTSTPYNNEPLINLSRCACDINNGYKKKKNVFTLKTKDGSEFLFHAKDEDDLKSWITSINSSISEHEEMAKLGQTNPTTSSTDEGTRRDGSRAGGSERGEKSDRADGGSVRSDKVEYGIRQRRGAQSSRVSERPLVAAEDHDKSGAPYGPKS